MPLKWKRATFKTHRKTGLWRDEVGYMDSLKLFGIHRTDKGSWILTLLSNGNLILSLALLQTAKNLADEMYQKWGEGVLCESKHPPERLREMWALAQAYIMK